jgi:hypothetical protein
LTGNGTGCSWSRGRSGSRSAQSRSATLIPTSLAWSPARRVWFHRALTPQQTGRCAFSARRQAHRCLRPDRPGRPANPRGRRHRDDRSPRVQVHYFEILRKFFPESGQRLGTSFPPNCKVCVNEIWKTHHCNSRGWAIARGRVRSGCVSRVPPAWRCDDRRTTPRPAMAESPRQCQGHRGDPKPSVPDQGFAGDRRNRPTQSITHETFTLLLPPLRPSPRSPFGTASRPREMALKTSRKAAMECHLCHSYAIRT